jgi:hypothetical protein
VADVTDQPDAAERAGLPDDRQAARDAAHIAEYEQRLAERRTAAIEAGRRKGGLAGAAMAGAMFAVSEIVEGPKKDDVSVVVEASSNPLDLERDGVSVELDDEHGGKTVESPPLERREAVSPPAKGLRKPPAV